MTRTRWPLQSSLFLSQSAQPNRDSTEGIGIAGNEKDTSFVREYRYTVPSKTKSIDKQNVGTLQIETIKQCITLPGKTSNIHKSCHTSQYTFHDIALQTFYMGYSQGSKTSDMHLIRGPSFRRQTLFITRSESEARQGMRFLE